MKILQTRALGFFISFICLVSFEQSFAQDRGCAFEGTSKQLSYAIGKNGNYKTLAWAINAPTHYDFTLYIDTIHCKIADTIYFSNGNSGKWMLGDGSYMIDNNIPNSDSSWNNGSYYCATYYNSYQGISTNDDTLSICFGRGLVYVDRTEKTETGKPLNIFSGNKMILTIPSEESEFLLELFDISGRKLFKNKFEGNNSTINLDEIPVSGIYIIRYSSSKSIKSFKVFVSAG